MAIRLLFSAVTWIVYQSLLAPLWALGFFVVPVALAFSRWQQSPIFPEVTILNAPRWLWLWGNDEDGYDPEWYREKRKGWPRWLRLYEWAAWRNPVNNVRFIRCLHPPQAADKVKWVTRGNFTYVWQGLFSRLIYDSQKYWFAIGWKYEPVAKDAERWQAFGQGFGMRLKRKAK